MHQFLCARTCFPCFYINGKSTCCLKKIYRLKIEIDEVSNPFLKSSSVTRYSSGVENGQGAFLDWENDVTKGKGHNPASTSSEARSGTGAQVGHSSGLTQGSLLTCYKETGFTQRP